MFFQLPIFTVVPNEKVQRTINKEYYIEEYQYRHVQLIHPLVKAYK